MRARSVRRFLHATNAVLALALVGAGGWYLLDVRTAAAGQRAAPDWVADAHRAYRAHVDHLTPFPVHPIDAKDLDCTTPPDLAERGVGVFVGPLPPEGRPTSPSAPLEASPTRLEEIGRPTAVYWMPENGAGLSTVVGWLFASGRTASVRVGEFFREGPGTAGRFRLRAVVRKDRERPVYALVYDVHDDEAGAAVIAGRESVFDLLGAVAAEPGVIRLAPASGASGGNAPGAGPPSGDDAVRAIPSGIVLEPLGENRFGVALDDAGFEVLRRAAPEGLLADVRTDVARDETGAVRGLRFLSVPPGSWLARFDVRNGDVLVSIAGKPVHGRAEAIEVLRGLPKGTSVVRAVVDRNGRLVVYDVDPRDPAARRAAGRLGYRDDPAATAR